jgi:hypothetical protein
LPGSALKVLVVVGWWAASYPLLSQAPTQVEVELGCDKKINGILISTQTSSAVDDTAEVHKSDDDLSEERRKLMENDYEAEKEATSIKPEASTSGWGFSAPKVRFILYD